MHSGAILYSTFSSEAIKQLVLTSYDFDDSVECTFLNRGLNDTYRVCFQHRQFALRLYRTRWRTREAVLGELAALLHLDSKGVPVATPVARCDGNLVTDINAPEGPRWAVLFNWAKGSEPAYRNETHARLFGKLAAQLHIAADDLICSARSPLDLNYLLERPVESLRPALQSHPLLAARFAGIVDRIRTRMESAKERLWDWGFCHGDLHCGNAHVEDEQLSLYDFDCCGPGWRVYDLATYRWAARLRQFEGGAWRPFSEAYLKVRPAAADTFKLVPLFVMLRHIWLQGYHAWNSPENGLNFPDGYFDHLVTFCEHLEAEQLDP